MTTKILRTYKEINNGIPKHLHYTWNNLNIMSAMDGDTSEIWVCHISLHSPVSNVLLDAGDWLDNERVNVKHVSVSQDEDMWSVYIFYTEGATNDRCGAYGDTSSLVCRKKVTCFVSYHTFNAFNQLVVHKDRPMCNYHIGTVRLHCKVPESIVLEPR